MTDTFNKATVEDALEELCNLRDEDLALAGERESRMREEIAQLRERIAGIENRMKRRFFFF